MTTRVKGSSYTTLDNVGYISLGDIGVGDGTTDNTAAIIAALATGVALYIPAGTFITGPITVPAGATIFGIGVKSILKLKPTSGLPMLTCGSNTQLSTFAIDGNKSNQVSSALHGVIFNNAVTSGALNLTIYNTKGDGINITGVSTSGVNIISCSVTAFTKNGVTVEAGVNISLVNVGTSNSDIAAAPGDGIALVSTGNTIQRAMVNSCTSSGNIGRGIALVGNGSRNVKNITITGAICTGNTSHGLHVLTAEKVTITGSLSGANTGDGIRLEGDVQSSRVTTCVTDTNSGFGIREVVAGSTPNLNGLIYNVALGNSSDVITKVGAGSFVV